MQQAGHNFLNQIPRVLDEAPATTLLRDERLPRHYLDDLKSYVVQPAAEIATQAQELTSPLIIGINGCQGSGKSTLVRFLSLMLEFGASLKVQSLSLDDFYLTRAQRQVLVHDVHPLFATRGVPGTHDVNSLDAVLEALSSKTADRVALPRFDKAIDDRIDRHLWPEVDCRPDVILLEGWCVGCPPQPLAELVAPVNELEEMEDKHGIWRRYINSQLEGPYAKIWQRLDSTLMLEAPGFECVYDWRARQEEQTLRQAEGLAERERKVMDGPALRRFIQHFQRLTEHQLQTLVDRADAVLKLSADQRLIGYRGSLSRHA